MAFVLENEFCRVECIEQGGEIQHFVDKEKQVELMYQGDQGWSGKNPSLFPIVGNTYTKEYEINGKTYAMKNHGLIRTAMLKGRQEEDTLIFTYDSDEETRKVYPFDFHYEIQYRLEHKTLKINYIIQNTGNEDMPFSFGLHPGFRVPMFDGEVFEDYSIDFEKEEHAKQLVFDPTFTNPVHYDDVHMTNWQLSYEDIDQFATIIYKDLQSDYVTLSYKGKPRVKVSMEGYPFLALWTHESRSDFICIEPWYGHADFEKETPDFYHREGTIVLKPNETFEVGYTIESLFV